MNKKEIGDKLRMILKNTLDKEIEIAPDNMEQELIRLGITSVDYIKLIVGIEEEFQIQLDDDSLLPENFKTVKDVITLIDNNLEKIHAT